MRQALITPSSMRLKFGSSQTSCHEDSLNEVQILTEYHKAVRQLQKYLKRDQPSTIVALTCCVLFYLFESTRGNFDAALEHLRNTVRILQAHTTSQEGADFSREATGSPEDMYSLTQVFRRMDVQATIFNNNGTPSLSWYSNLRREASVVTATIISLDQAQETLDQLMNHFFNFLGTYAFHKVTKFEDLPITVVEGKCELLVQCNGWSAAFDE